MMAFTFECKITVNVRGESNAKVYSETDLQIRRPKCEVMKTCT